MLLITQSNVAFLSTTETEMVVLPVHAVVAVRTTRYQKWNTHSDNSLMLRMESGKTEQFDGFWERDECLNLILAAGRFCGHTIAVETDGEDAPSAGAGARATPSKSTAAS